MPLVPAEWNVVVNGHWNRGILTPSGISHRLFQLPPNTALQIEVPLDAIGPYRVLYDNVVVMAGSNQLIVEASICDMGTLEKALVVAHRAVQDLPETPVTAAGYNIRYQGQSTDPGLQPLLAALESAVDLRLAETSASVQGRGLVRTLAWEGGKINLGLGWDAPEILKVQFNFERIGTREEMMAWLQRPIGQVKEKVRSLVLNVLGLPREMLP